MSNDLGRQLQKKLLKVRKPYITEYIETREFLYSVPTSMPLVADGIPGFAYENNHISVTDTTLYVWTCR